MILIVCGMKSEANIINNPAGSIVLQGVNGDVGLADQIEAVVAKSGIKGIMSVGVSGGLAPSLHPGEVIVCRRATGDTSRSVYADPRWAANIAVSLSGASRKTAAPPFIGTIGYSRSVVAKAADKLALRADQSADAVDMETWIVASVAHKHNLPFAALRTISDPYDFDLPPAALAALSATGSIDFGSVIASVLGDPEQVPALLKLAEYDRLANQNLADALLAIGPDFGFPT
jgi:hypothetical protein